MHTVPGCKANSLDIAPKYGGIIYGMSNTVANIPGFLTPQVAGLLLNDDVSGIALTGFNMIQICCCVWKRWISKYSENSLLYE